MTMHPIDKKLFDLSTFIIFVKTFITVAWAFLIFTCLMYLPAPGMFRAFADYCLGWMYP